MKMETNDMNTFLRGIVSFLVKVFWEFVYFATIFKKLKTWAVRNSGHYVLNFDHNPSSGIVAWSFQKWITDFRKVEGKRSSA
jgi:hypothetical protein